LERPAWPLAHMITNGFNNQWILARLRWRAPWPGGKGGGVRVWPVSFPICPHFRRLLIGLNVPASAEYEPDKPDRHQDGACDHQPMWISHLGISSSPNSLSFRLLLNISALHSARRRRLQHAAPAIMIAVSKLSVRKSICSTPTLGRCAGRRDCPNGVTPMSESPGAHLRATKSVCRSCFRHRRILRPRLAPELGPSLLGLGNYSFLTRNGAGSCRRYRMAGQSRPWVS
jgi:hypothetical protein